MVGGGAGGMADATIGFGTGAGFGLANMLAQVLVVPLGITPLGLTFGGGLDDPVMAAMVLLGTLAEADA